MHAVQAELRQLAHQLAREHALLEPVADLGQDPLAHELAHGVAYGALLLVEQAVEREVVEGVEGGELGRDGHGDLRVE